MDIQTLLQEEADLKEQLDSLSKEIDKLYEIKDEADIALRVYWYDDKNLHRELYTPEYDKLFCRLNDAYNNLLPQEALQNMIELRYLDLSTNLRKLGY